MTLQAAPSLAGRTFTVRGADGVSLVVAVDEEGFLSTEVQVSSARDEHGNLLELVEVEHPQAGEPPLQYFRFPELDGEVPADNRPFAVEVNGELVVPVRYVRGQHMAKEFVELTEEMEEAILNHQGMRQLIRRVEDAEDEQEDSEAEELQSEDLEDEASEAEEE